MSLTFGELLKAEREKRDWSQSELARRSGINQQVISRYEDGLNSPSWLNVVVICDALEVPLDTFRGTMPAVVKGRVKKERQEGGEGGGGLGE